jgi:glycosyltransferase involved in cell wall biosynthesis
VKLLCFIDCLGSGGAQRQLATLAVGLKKRGHEVRFLVYHPQDHFLPQLQEADIPCQVIPPHSRWRRALAVRRVLRQGWQEVVLAFLEASCLYAELARIPRQRWGLVVGERSANPRILGGVSRWFRQFHRSADVIVCNSHTNRLMLEARFPFLKQKLTTIYNTVDLQLFRPALGQSTTGSHSSSGPCRIVVAASYQGLKNMGGVARAMVLLRTIPPAQDIVVDWFGGIGADPTPYHEAVDFITANALAGQFNFHPETRAIEKVFAGASAVGLFSFFEGLPNVVCEGMACGKPIVLSNVCDAGSLVRDGKNGFLCDPSSPESIAKAFGRLAGMSFEERQQMGSESRAVAEDLFCEQIVVERYEKIFEAAARHEPVPAGSTWPAQVPESAVATAERWASGRQVERAW